MTQIKFSADQLAANVQRNQEFAFELGFAKLAQDEKLTKEQYESLYNSALAKLGSLDKPKA